MIFYILGVGSGRGIAVLKKMMIDSDHGKKELKAILREAERIM